MLTRLVILIFHLLHYIPPRLLGACGAGIGRLLFYLLRKHREITLRNLRRVYVDRDQHWHWWTARETFAELGRSMFELPHVFLSNKDDLLARVDIEGYEELSKIMQQHQGVIQVAAHHCNWELGTILLSILCHPSGIIYRPMKHAGLDLFLKQCRERFGMTTHSRFDGIRWLPKLLRDGGAVGIMVDQHMSQGVQIPFMGHHACTTTLPAMFAVRQNTPIFLICLRRIGRDFRFRLSFEPVPLPALDENKEQNYSLIMELIGERFASIIDERPELWLWLHKRWWILEHDPNAVQS